MFWEKSDSRRTKIFYLQDRLILVEYLLKFKDAIIADSSIVLMYKFKLLHSLYDGLFLFKTILSHTCIDFLFKNEFEIIIWIMSLIPNKVQMIERTQQSIAKVVKLFVDAIFEVFKRHV